MKDEYLWNGIVLVWWIMVVFTLLVAGITVGMQASRVSNEVRNVLPVNEDKELVKPEEVRQYVLAMADIKGVNVDMVDKIGYCESRWRYDAVSRSGTYVGIFQIGKLHGLGDDRFDVVKSTKWSLEKMKKEGFKAWECSRL